jgi:hypothetical protein
MPHGTMIAQQQQQPQQQQMPHQPQASIIKENGFYKRVI